MLSNIPFKMFSKGANSVRSFYEAFRWDNGVAILLLLYVYDYSLMLQTRFWALCADVQSDPQKVNDLIRAAAAFLREERHPFDELDAVANSRAELLHMLKPETQGSGVTHRHDIAFRDPHY